MSDYRDRRPAWKTTLRRATAWNRTCQSRTRSRVGWGCLGLIVLSLMILACGLGLYEGVTLRDDLVSHGLSSAVPIPVAADRSTATATRH